MKHFNSKLPLTLLLLMCATITFAHDIAVANSDGKTIYYNINWGGSSVSVTYQGSHHDSYSNEYTGDVVIPETVTYGGKTYSVTSIGASAFRNCSGLTSVTIHNSVTSIGSCAFEGCSGLEKVIVPNIDLKKWCRITFANFTANPLLNAHHLYNDENTEITELVIPDGVTSIPNYVFSGCSGLTSVTIPNSVTNIGQSAFSRCSGLTSVTIGNSVTSIRDEAFYCCSGLTSVTIPNSVTSIGSDAFYHTRIKSLTIGTGIRTIASDAFSYSSSTYGAKPEKVIWLANTPPSGYKDVGGTINYVPNDSYSGLSGQKIYPFLSSMFEVDGIKYVPVSTSERTCAVIDYVYKESTENINIVIPENVTYSDETYGVTSIGSSAFRGRSGLTSVTIPNGVTSIGERAFYYCSGLTSVTIPNSVTSIGSYAFLGCSGLKKVIVPDFNIKNWCSFKYDADNENPLYYAHHLYSDENTEITELVIPDGVTSIGNRAFLGCSGLTSVTIPNSVTSIGTSAFSDCSGLAKVIVPNIDIKNWCSIKFASSTANPLYYAHHLYSDENTEITKLAIPDGVTYISNYVFYGCSGLTSVTIPNSVTSIGSYAFNRCSGLTSVTIPNSVTSIGDYAFYGCSGLTSVTIPNSVTEIGSDAFRGCSRLTSVTIPNSVTYIGQYAFYGCSGLTSVIIGNSVTSINSQAFYNTRIISLTIGTGIRSIASDAFSYQYGAKPVKVIWLSNTPPSGYGNVGGTVNYVPNDSYSGLSNMKVYPLLSNYFFEVDGIKYVLISQAERTCEAIDCINKYNYDLIIPNSVTYRNITLTVKNVGYAMCYGKSHMIRSVTIPNSVTSIGDFAFYDCGLTSVTIPNSVTSIGSFAFGETSWYMKQPDGLVYAGNVAYSYKGTMPANTSITLKEGTVGIASYAFRGRSGLASVTIPNSVTSIGSYAFSDCSGLTSVNIGNNVTSIDKYAFKGSTSMTKFKIRATVPPTCGTQALDDINTWECTLYVPMESIDDYKTMDPWKNFFIETIRMDGDSNGDDVVNAKDYSGVASYIMGDSPEEFDVEASDVDVNGTVDVRDYVGIANIISTGSIYGGTSNNAKAAMSKGAAMPATDDSDAENVIYVENVSGSKDSQVELSVCMRNASDIRGFQFDLYLPEGVSMANNAKASLSSDRLAASDAHTLMVNEVTDGAVRFLCSSMNDESFAVGDGEIATLTVNIADNMANGDYDVVVKNALMTETDISKSYEADNIKSTLTVLDQTGVETVTADNERRDGSIYTVGGQLVGKKATTSQLRKGIYIRNGKKIVVK